MKARPKTSITLKLYNWSPMELKPSSSETLSKDQVYEKMPQALDKIKVATAKFTEKIQNISKCT